MAAPHTPPDDHTLAGTIAGSRSSSGAGTSALLEMGTVLAGRYELAALLGEGGMGAVYKARDRELDRIVALKTIRPEMATSGDMLARFKQEVLLASQITHPNVIRLYDLGEAEGTKFITMEFVEGDDLRSLLFKHGKFTPTESAEIIRQVCLALESAHAKGVVHRDLKPQNIMRDRQGRVVVMDFGLARSLSLGGMTQTGALMGTMEYMSPEQALGKPVDQRSDIFAVGLIFYELLSGKQPYEADSAVASLLKRSQERARAVSDVEGGIPRSVSNVVARCLEREPEKRYGNVTELLADLGRQGDAARARVALRLSLPRRKMWLAMALCALLITGGVTWSVRTRLWPARTTAVAAPEVSLAILPLRNTSGDPSADWLGSSVADMLATDIGQSARLRTVSSDRIHQILQDLRIGAGSGMDEATVTRLASFADAGVVVTGQYVKLGDRLRLDVSIRDLKHDRTTPIKVEAANESELPAAVDRLAQSIRGNLALSPDAVKELAASAFKPSTKSVDALRAYNQGLGFLRQGKQLEARQALDAATKADPQFALAYAKLAQADANLGYGDQAEQASRRAVDLSESLPAAEKFRIGAEHARIMKDFPKAIDAYERLAKVAPQDADVQFALARLYEDARSLDPARAHYERLLTADPKNIDALLGMGRVNLLLGDAQASLDPLNRALGLAVQLGNADQKGAALFFLGTAYAILNQSGDAMRNFQESLDIRRSRGDKGGTAQTLNSIAKLEQSLGHSAQALKSYEEALQLRRDIGDKHGMANTLLDLGTFHETRGEYDQALDLTKQSLQLHRELGDVLNQATCLSNIGWFYLQKGDFENAMTYFQQALDVREKLKDPSSIADTVYNLADTSARVGRYDAAVNYYLRAIDLWRQANDKRGVATADYGMGGLFADQGRYGAALKADTDALRNFREANETGVWMVQAQAAYGRALALAGRSAEAGKSLGEAVATARRLDNETLLAHVLSFEGDAAFFAGDYKNAGTLYQQALDTASRARDKEDALTAKLGLAKVAVREGRAREAVRSLRTLADDADRTGLKYASVECSSYFAEALLAAGDKTRARTEIERAITASDKLELNGLRARSRYVLALVMRASGDNSGAADNEKEARRVLDDIRKETGSDDVQKRSDFVPVLQSRKQIAPRAAGDSTAVTVRLRTGDGHG